MSGWQPIETAPKDGRFIIAFHDPGEDAEDLADCVTVAWWRRNSIPASWFNALGGFTFDPTHWLPLPDPPGADPGKSIGEEIRDAATEALIRTIASIDEERNALRELLREARSYVRGWIQRDEIARLRMLARMDAVLSGAAAAPAAADPLDSLPPIACPGAPPVVPPPASMSAGSADPSEKVRGDIVDDFLEKFRYLTAADIRRLGITYEVEHVERLLNMYGRVRAERDQALALLREVQPLIATPVDGRRTLEIEGVRERVRVVLGSGQ